MPPLLPPRGHDIERRNSRTAVSSKPSNDIVLMVRAHSGATRRLKNYHSKWLTPRCQNASTPSMATTLTAYIDGLYGSLLKLRESYLDCHLHWHLIPVVNHGSPRPEKFLRLIEIGNTAHSIHLDRTTYRPTAGSDCGRVAMAMHSNAARHRCAS